MATAIPEVWGGWGGREVPLPGEVPISLPSAIAFQRIFSKYPPIGRQTVRDVGGGPGGVATERSSIRHDIQGAGRIDISSNRQASDIRI